MWHTNSQPFILSAFVMQHSYNGQKSQSSYRQRSQSPSGQRPVSPWTPAQQVSNSRPGTPYTTSQNPASQNQLRTYPHQTAVYSGIPITFVFSRHFIELYPHVSIADPSRPMQYTNCQQSPTPTVDHTGRYQYPVVASTGIPMYGNPDPRYPPDANQYSSSQHISDVRGPRGAQFFPTPSQTMLHRQHTSTSTQSHHQSSSVSSSANTGPSPRNASASPVPVPLSQHYPSLQHPSQQTAPHTNAPNYASTSTSGERHKCPECGASFGRVHDRKRHYETQHLASPPVHRCQSCLKGYSRADSLKRHIDNGCDGMCGD